MSEIVLVDTSVLMNVLNVPGRNQDRAAVIAEFTRLVQAGAHLFLPMAAVFEAGNHIAQLPDGRARRTAATIFGEQIERALSGDAPWKPMRFPDQERLRAWVDEFPDAAMRGLGMGDLSILKDWQEQCTVYAMSRVRVWALDDDLAGLDRQVG